MLASPLGQHGDTDELPSAPFMVGDLDKTKAFIHILTESTLNVLLQTLDTISDFIWYLEKRRNFLET